MPLRKADKTKLREEKLKATRDNFQLRGGLTYLLAGVRPLFFRNFKINLFEPIRIDGWAISKSLRDFLPSDAKCSRCLK